MKKYHVYGLGNALVDMEFEVDDEFFQQHKIDKGRMTLVEASVQQTLIEQLQEHHHKRACGGSAANTVMAVSHFGGQVYYCCKIASDATGDFFVDDLTKAGVDTNVTAGREAGVTGSCLVMVTPDAERTMNTFLGISEALSVVDLDLDAIAQSDYVYAEGYLVTSHTGREAAKKMYDTARQAGVKTVMTFSDPAMVQYFQAGLIEMLGQGIDLLFCNKEEALIFANTSSLEHAIEVLKQHTKTLVITLGGQGALIHDGETTASVPGFKVTPIDTNGAGDLFAGAFLYALSQGHNFLEAGQLANLSASKLVTHFGPRLPSQEHPLLLKEFQSL